MAKDITLPNRASHTSALSDDYMDKIIVFLRAWLEALKNAFLNDRSGYHLLPQVWQALGFTVHELVSKGASLSEPKASGKALGRLDYSKNAATSTRLFRVGLFEYLYEKLEW